MNIKAFAALFVRALSGFLSTRFKQETRNLTLQEAAACEKLNFIFLVCKLVLVNRDNALQECCNP